MGNTVLGVVAPLPQGEWNSTTTYQKLSVVREGNSSYIAKSANVNIQPGVTDSWETYWMLLNEDGDTGQQGPQGATGVGVPDGGLKGYILIKRSQANYDDEWVDPANITVGNATKALQDGNGNNIADTYQTKQDSTTQNTALQTQITSNTQGITQNSQLISRNSARLTNVEQRISPSPFVTDSTVAYVKDVPANALPFAELQKLGGMTRKCTNLLPFPYAGSTLTAAGVTWTVNNDGRIVVSGTPTDYTALDLARNLNVKGLSDICFYLNGSYSNITLCMTLFDSEKNILQQIATGAIIHLDISSYPTADSLNIFLKRSDNNIATTGDFYPMLNTGATALPYEPYFEGLRSAPATSVDSVGANLIPFPYNSNSGIINGVTITVNNDGSITLKGTATKTFNYTIFSDNSLEGIGVKEGETLWVSSGGATVSFGVYDVTDGVTYNSERSFTVDITHIYRIRINIGIGESVDTTVYPMLNKGATALPYAPYTKSTLSIPEAVQALDGYGEGISESVYNYITWNPEGNIKTYTKAVETVVFDGAENITLRGQNAAGLNVFLCSINPFAKIAPLSTDFDFVEFVTGDSPVLNGSATDGAFYMLYNNNTSAFISVYFISAQATVEDFKQSIIGKSITYALYTPEVTDISALITADNLIPVQGNGTITFVNEYGYAVPSTVEYMT